MRWIVLIAVTALLPARALLATEAPPVDDKITVKGTVLRGRVIERATNGIRFETVYGEGEILIPYDDVEALKLDGKLQNLSASDESTTVARTASPAEDKSTNRIEVAQQDMPLGTASPEGVESQIDDRLLIQQSFLEREKDFLGLPTYYAAQEWLDHKIGLRLGVAYTTLALGATDSLIGEPQGAAGGDFDFFGRWDTWGQKSGNEGIIGFNLRHRHAYTDIPPSVLGSAIGSLWNVTGGFTDAGFEFTQLYLDQYFLDKKVGFRFGQMFMDSIFNTYEYKSAKLYFVNAAFSDNPAVAFPRYGVGFSSLIKPVDGWYVLSGIGDSTGRQLTAGVPDLLASETFFTGLEIGWSPVAGPLTNHHFAVFVWHTPADSDSATPDGEGLTFTYEWLPEKQYGFFARYSGSATEATRVEHLATTGMVWRGPLGRELDVFGVAGGFGSATRPGVDGQGVIEVFYRLQVTPLFQITPDIQLLIEPSQNPEQDFIAVFGIRGRIAL